MNVRFYFSALIAAITVAVIAAVSWHSVQEIHYLKTFYPNHFTVKDTLYASGVELIKVWLISFPLLVILGVTLYLVHSAHR